MRLMLNMLWVSVFLFSTACSDSDPVRPAPNELSNPDPVNTSCVELVTNKGTITLRLDNDNAPTTVSNFTAYVNAGFYNGTIFHRVIDGFMIQGGGYTADLVRKETSPPIVNEANNGLKNLVGTIAMARTTAPHSATSQFFINTVDNATLDYTAQNWGYAVFGNVTAGMSVVEAISDSDTGSRAGFDDVPLQDIVINRADVVACN